MIAAVSLKSKQKKLISILYLNYKKIIVFHSKKKNYYIEIKKHFNIKKLSITELRLSTSRSYRRVFNSFSRFVQYFSFLKRKILLLKGLGLKVFVNRISRTLLLKLGFSHPYNIFIKNEIFLRLKKNVIFLQSFNKEVLGNFAMKIKNLRIPDAYKGKGIWYKTEQIKLKPVKKK